MLRINIIGAGRLGQSLAWLLHHHGLATVQAVVCRTLPAASQAVAHIGAGQATTLDHPLPQADVTWITTPDQPLQSICHWLVNQQSLLPNSIVVHSSGAQPASILSDAKTLGCAIASLHPMKSFNDPNQCQPSLTGVYLGVEGDDRALACLTPLLTQLGARVVTIDAAHKTLYHAAAVLASNFMPLLYDCATRCFAEAGLDATAAHHSTLALMQSAQQNLAASQSASRALTGPVQRGDVTIIQEHLRALTEQLPALAPLYQQLSAATARLVCNDPQRAEVLAALHTPLTDDIA